MTERMGESTGRARLPSGLTPAPRVLYVSRHPVRIELGALNKRLCFTTTLTGDCRKWYGTTVPTAVGLASEAALHGVSRSGAPPHPARLPPTAFARRPLRRTPRTTKSYR